jgi:branched-chain amino acid transport system permease protein
VEKRNRGDDGLRGIVRPDIDIPGILSINLHSSMHYYYFGFFVPLLSFITIRRITILPFSRVIQGIRENEVRAPSIGYNTRIFKIIVFALGNVYGARWQPI